MTAAGNSAGYHHLNSYMGLCMGLLKAVMWQSQSSEPKTTKHSRRKKKAITYETNQQGQGSGAPLLCSHIH